MNKLPREVIVTGVVIVTYLILLTFLWFDSKHQKKKEVK